MRSLTQPPYVTLGTAMARAQSHNLPKPMVLADVSDNAGGGASSDSTFILRELLDRKIEDAAIAMFWDPGAVKLAFEVGEVPSSTSPGRQDRAAIRPADRRPRQVLKLEKDVFIKFGGQRKGTNTIGDAAALQIAA